MATDADQYKLLIHSLTHEHTAANTERHVLLLTKWLRDCEDGILLRDLESVTTVISILRKLVTSDAHIFKPVAYQFLKLCSKPLLEISSNERLRPKSIAAMKAFYFEITEFWADSDVNMKLAVAHCLRCIANGGRDPSVLRAEAPPLASNGKNQPVTDSTLIQSIFRDCQVLERVVTELTLAAESLDSQNNKFLETLTMYTSNLNQPSFSNPSEELKDYIGSNNEDAESSARMHGDPTSLLKSQKLELSLSESLAQELAALCEDVSVEAKNAAMLCSKKVINGLVLYLQSIFTENIRDKRIGMLVELTWTVLDAYITQYNTSLEKSKLALGGYDGEELSDEMDLNEVMDLQTAFHVFYSLLHRLTYHGFRDVDKDCRNATLAIMTLIAESPSTHVYFVQSGLLDGLVYLGCAAEATDMTDPDPATTAWLTNHPFADINIRHFGTSSELDLQFKKEIWFLISDLLKTNDPQSLQCVQQSPILATMLMYAHFDTIAPAWAAKGSLASGGGEMSSPSLHADRSQSIPLSNAADDGESAETSTLGSVPKRGGVRWDEQALPRRPLTTETPLTVSTYGAYDPVPPTGGETNAQPLPLKRPEAQLTMAKSKSYMASIPRIELMGLQVLSMMFLAENAWKMLDAFAGFEGPMKVYDCVLHYCTSEFEEHKTLVGYATVLLNRLIKSSEEVRSLMESQNAIQLLLFLFEMGSDEDTRSQAIHSAAILCQPEARTTSGGAAMESPSPAGYIAGSGANVSCQTQLRMQGGITLLVSAIRQQAATRKPQVGLRAGVKVLEQYAMDPKDESLEPLSGDVGVYIIAALDCIARGIVGNVVNEVEFAANDGVDALLELLESSPCVLRIQILRIISDILENPELGVYAKNWRSSKTMRSAVQLATHCWLDEEERLKGQREKGVICDIFNPLGNHDWAADANAQSFDGFGPVDNASSGSSVTTEVSSRSIAVTRLATAIFQSRFNKNIGPGNVELEMRRKVLERDVRGIVASILQLLGVFESKSILDMDSSNNLNSSSLTDHHGPGSVVGTVASNYSMMVNDGTKPQIVDESQLIHTSSHAPSSPLPSNGTALGSPIDAQGSVGSLRSPLRFPSQLAGSGIDHLHAIESEEDVAAQDTSDLSVSERQVIAIARRYAVLREGSWWTDIAETLKRDGVQPIEADSSMLFSQLDRFFDAAQTVQMEQMALRELEEKKGRGAEKKFIDNILSLEAQNVKTEWIKRNSKNTKSKKSHTYTSNSARSSTK